MLPSHWGFHSGSAISRVDGERCQKEKISGHGDGSLTSEHVAIVLAVPEQTASTIASQKACRCEIHALVCNSGRIWNVRAEPSSGLDLRNGTQPPSSEWPTVHIAENGSLGECLHAFGN